MLAKDPPQPLASAAARGACARSHGDRRRLQAAGVRLHGTHDDGHARARLGRAALLHHTARAKATTGIERSAAATSQWHPVCPGAASCDAQL